VNGQGEGLRILLFPVVAFFLSIWVMGALSQAKHGGKFKPSKGTSKKMFGRNSSRGNIPHRFSGFRWLLLTPSKLSEACSICLIGIRSR
jgi:hypothetical protein